MGDWRCLLYPNKMLRYVDLAMLTICLLCLWLAGQRGLQPCGPRKLGMCVLTIQRIRDILLGKVKAPNHHLAGVGVGGGFLSLAPEWQK